MRKQSFQKTVTRDSTAILHVIVGYTAVLEAQSRRGDAGPPSWKSPSGAAISTGSGRYSLESAGQASRLRIETVEVGDAGEYTAVFSNLEMVKVVLTVSRVPHPPPQPRVQDLKVNFFLHINRNNSIFF